MELNRRDLIKGAVGAGTVIGSGALATLYASQGAQASSDFTIGDASLSNDDGDLKLVGVKADHRVTWENFDYSVDAAAYVDVIQELDGSGNVVSEHVLYNNTDPGDDPGPILLDNWSGRGTSEGGWGGPGEWTSGPGTTGYVRADINWIVLAEHPKKAAKSVEEPGDLSNFSLDNDTDGKSKTTTLRYKKKVHLYTKDSSGSATTPNGPDVRKLGADDGTVGVVPSQDQFTVTVTNQAASAESSGSGDSYTG